MSKCDCDCHVKDENPRKSYWKREEEDLLKQWADKAQCYQWLHMKAREKYQRKNALYTIPVIIISTTVGTANFAQDRVSEENRKYMVMGIGALSIVAGVISTVSQFLKISELNEAHRIATLSWGKFYRAVKTELSRHPLDRSAPYDIINYNKEEFDRLVEISPPIPKKILKDFKLKFKKVNDLVIPEMCDHLAATEIYEISEEERNQLIEDLFDEKTEEKQVPVYVKDSKDKYRETFFNLNGRYPSESEMKSYVDKLNDEPIPEESNDSVV